MEVTICYQPTSVNQVTTKKFYCDRVDRLKSALDGKRATLIARYKVPIYRNNEKPRLAMEAMQDFNWETMDLVEQSEIKVILRKRERDRTATRISAKVYKLIVNRQMFVRNLQIYRKKSDRL